MLHAASRVLSFKLPCDSANPRSPIPGRTCVVGDSQARHLYNALTSIVANNMTFIKTHHVTSDKTIVNGSHFRVFDDHWGECLAPGRVNHSYGPGQAPDGCDFTNSNSYCDVILYNFGHWQSAWVEGFASSQSMLAQHVEYVFAIVSSNTYLRDRFIVVTNHPGDPPHASQPVEWRNMAVLSMYDKTVISLAKKYRIRVIDISHVGMPLMDLPYDAGSRHCCHYKAPVEVGVAYYVLHHLSLFHMHMQQTP